MTATDAIPEPRTLGDMTTRELLDSAENEAEGLRTFLDGKLSAEDFRWASAFVTSVRVRLAVADMKVAQDLRENH